MNIAGSHVPHTTANHPHVLDGAFESDVTNSIIRYDGMTTYYIFPIICTLVFLCLGKFGGVAAGDGDSVQHTLGPILI